MSNKKSQITLFIILGVVIILVIVTMLLLARTTTKQAIEQESREAQSIPFDVQTLNQYIEDCVTLATNQGVGLLGKQGGYIYKSQGGTLLDFQKSDEGIYYLNTNGTRIAFNILQPRFPFTIFSPSIPTYPWETFPYTDNSRTVTNFDAPHTFGFNAAPPRNRSFGAHSLQTQLERYISFSIDNCMASSAFTEQNYKVVDNKKRIQVNIYDNEIQTKIDSEIRVRNTVTETTTHIDDVSVKVPIQFGKLHAFITNLIIADTSNIFFNIEDGFPGSPYTVTVEKNVFKHDDIIKITDPTSTIDGRTFEYSFARKNRHPALYHLSPSEITLPTFSDAGEFTIVTENDIIADYPTDLVAADPDEDEITLDDFSFNPEPPQELRFPQITFTVRVSDGELEDYQELTVRRR